MKYCVDTKERGLYYNPGKLWNGQVNYEFNVIGMSDANFATNPDDRKSVISTLTLLEGCAVVCKSKTMPVVALSVTEAELYAAVSCAQDMIYVMRVLEGMNLMVKKPMILKIDNKGAIDLINNWSVGGRTRHIETKQYWIRELKASNIIKVEWVNTEAMTADVNTKNVSGPLFIKHIKPLVGVDKYM